MIDRVQALATYIKDQNALFVGTGDVLLSTNDIGINDEFTNGFYIGFVDGLENVTFEPTDANPKMVMYRMAYELKLVAWFQCVRIDDAAKILARQLRQYGDVIVNSISFDSYAIYNEETETDLNADIQLLQITFTMYGATTLNDCEDLTICDDICC